MLNAVFYYNGLNFALRGGSEHRDLCISQFVFSSESVQDGDSMKSITFVEYTKFGSKNRQGGKKQLNLANKSVWQYSQPSLGTRCHIYLLQPYLSKLPLV